MTELAVTDDDPAVPAPAGVPAVEVVDLRKEFVRRDRKAGRFARKRRAPALAASRSRWSAARRSRSSARTAPASRRSSACSRRCCCTTAAARASSATTSSPSRAAVRRLVNRVSVEASFFKKMSAAENLQLRGALLRDDGRARRATRSRASSSASASRSSARGEPMENLSRGMQQKVALARALLTSPVLLLLDEPTTGLDPRSKLEVQEFIREMRATHDATILLCTHDLAEAESLADRVGILDRGRLLALEPRRRAEAALRRARRSRRRSSPRPAARSRTRPTRTTTTREVFA